MNRSKKRHGQLALAAATISNTLSQTKTANLLGVKRSFVEYHQIKSRDPNFHNGTVGGARHVKFNEFDQKCVVGLLQAEIARNPHQTCRELAGFLTNQGYAVDRQ
jgi:hypothetical protein